MKTVNKDSSSLTVQRSTLPQSILGKLNDLVVAWNAGRTEDIVAITNTITDLGVAWEQLQASPEVEGVLLFPGVGAHLSQESDFGKKIIELKVAVENRNFEQFKDAVANISTQFEAQEINDSSDDSENPENPEEENAEPDTEGNPASPDVQDDGTSEPEQEPAEQEPVASIPEVYEPTTPGSALDSPGFTRTEKSDSAKGASWGFDLAKEFSEEKRKAKLAKQAKDELERKKKAASYEESDFSWDEVRGGKFRGE